MSVAFLSFHLHVIDFGHMAEGFSKGLRFSWKAIPKFSTGLRFPQIVSCCRFFVARTLLSLDKLGKKKRARHSCWRANRYYYFKRGALLVHIYIYIGEEKNHVQR